MSHVEQDFANRIRALGYRFTPQRELILDTLCDMGGHAPINQIYAKVQTASPEIDRATVYRSINFFHKIGFVVSAEIEGATVYEIAEEQPHHHLLCTICGKIDVLENSMFDDLTERIRHQRNFVADINHLTIRGTCAGCVG